MYSTTKSDNIGTMHAYLLVGTNNEELKAKSEELAKKFGAKTISFPLKKIADVRDLGSLLKTTFPEPTIIYSENIDEAGEEALNAFLKNLEEPQPNIYFVLTAPSVKKVLPTIVSRCQIIKSTNPQIYKSANENEIEEFLKRTAGQKLLFFDKMKEREEAKKFIESLIFFLHQKKDFKNMEVLIQTLTRLKMNGNVSLQLTNLIVRMNSL